MAKAKKPRAKTYEKPFMVKGTFEDVIKVAVKKKPVEKKKEE
jgi:hypothetical protein